MPKKNALTNLRTWIEIDARAAKKNYETFRALIGPRVLLWSVVKSNAYGHGLFAFSKLAQKFGVDGFCVDSLVEGIALRKDGVKKPILVLGPTLPSLYKEAAKQKITISISNFEALKALAKTKNAPEFHIKIDTGMHRQGFYVSDLPKVIKTISDSAPAFSKKLTGLYTHFASAKDINYPTYTDEQLKNFKKAVDLFEKAGFKKLIKHAAATGGTLIDPKYHFDAVRVGIGLHGLWPSKELEVQLRDKIELYPTLSWRAVVTEVKDIKKGDYVGYDMSERINADGKMAVLPIGYWHGFSRSLSSIGEVIINGGRAKVLGKVSMDITVVAPKNKIKPGAIVTLIGRDGKEEIFAWEIAQRSGTTSYEFVTRLNPLIERIVTNQ